MNQMYYKTAFNFDDDITTSQKIVYFVQFLGISKDIQN